MGNITIKTPSQTFTFVIFKFMQIMSYDKQMIHFLNVSVINLQMYKHSSVAQFYIVFNQF